MPLSCTKFLLVPVVLILVPLLIYLPGLGGTFLFDDFPNIIDNDRLQVAERSISEWLRASLSGFSGPLLRPVSMFSFALNLEFCGHSPRCFKVTNLAIHTAAGVMLFMAVVLLLRRYMKISSGKMSENALWVMAAAVALVWLLHPINLTSVVYVVQRMNSLAGLFAFAGLWLYLIGRQKLEDGRGGKIYILAAFALIVPAMLSKENGALLPLFLLLIEGYFYRFKACTAGNTLFVRGLFLLMVALPALAVLIFLVANPDWLMQRYENRDFTLTERTLTQPRVLWLYISLILLPTNQRLSLFHDQFAVSQGLMVPATTLLSLGGLCALLVIIFWSRHRARLLSFGLAFFLVGHLVESTVIPLEMIFEHRNYIPLAGLLIPLVYYLYSAEYSSKTCRIRRTALIGMLLLFAIVTHMRAMQWGDPLLLAELEAQSNPESARVNNFAGRTYANAYDHVPEEFRDAVYQSSHDYYQRACELDPMNIVGLTSLIMLESRAKGMTDYRWYAEILAALNEKKITPSDSKAIKKLLECQRKQICPSGIDEFKHLVNAVEANPNQSKKYKAILYTNFSQHYWHHFNRKAKALDYSRKAYLIYPKEITLKLNYARILIAQGELQQAKAILTEAQAQDKLGIHAAAIADIRQAIND